MHSEDGRWWWDGAGWRSALNVDRQLWFDGRSWVPSQIPVVHAQRPVRRPRTRMSAGPAYRLWLLALLSAPLLLLYGILLRHQDVDTSDLLLPAKVLAFLAVLATLGFGVAIGRSGAWLHLLWGPLVGTAALMLWVLVTFGLALDYDGDLAADTLRAGIGTAVGLAVLLGIGAGVGAIVHAASPRR